MPALSLLAATLQLTHLPPPRTRTRSAARGGAAAKAHKAGHARAPSAAALVTPAQGIPLAPPRHTTFPFLSEAAQTLSLQTLP